jgi:L-lactate dehydrogenase complex protein LldG
MIAPAFGVKPAGDRASAATDVARNTAAREAILARIREALRVPAPLPHFKAQHAPDLHASGGSALAANGLPTLSVLPAEAARPWLPDGGETPAERLAILTANLEKLRAVVHHVPDMTAAADCLFAIAREKGWSRVAWHGHPLVEPLLAGVPCATYRVDDAATGCDKDALEACDAGLTACETLVAQTGSILVSSDTCGGRGLSILPHAHVVIATTAQIVGTVGDALDLVRHRHVGRLPSMLSFITGPSRTGDIERILVLGAHGPKELFVILVEDSPRTTRTTGVVG